MSPVPDDYVDVAQQLREFRGLYPEGSLQSKGNPFLFTVGEKAYIAYCAAAYRHPDDKRPGVGWAWEPVPGPTPFTRDSELQNAETSAWGRAIVALGFETKRIASADEVRNRSAGEIASPGREAGAPAGLGDGGAAPSPNEGFPVSMPETVPGPPKKVQIGEMNDLMENLELQEARRNPTWREIARRFMEEQLGVVNGAIPNEAQFETVLEFMRPFLKERLVKP